MLIAILGPDGTGKTTLAKSLAISAERLDYVYFGYNNYSRKYRYFNSFIKRDSRGFIRRVLKKLARYPNDLHVFIKSKHEHTISDRAPVDSYINCKTKNSKMQYYYLLFLLITPKPDYVILLEGDGNKIYHRKKERTPEEIRKSILIYKKYLAKSGIPYSIIDTTEHNIVSTHETAVKVLLEVLK